MTDWRRQTEEMMRNLTQVQRDMWDSWAKTVARAGGSTAPGDAWQQAASAWQDAMRRSLAAQVEWSQLWADSLRNGVGMPKEVSAWTEQLLSTMKTWNDSQTKFWEQFTEMVRSMPPEGMNKALDENARRAFSMWQEAIQKSIDAQQEFLRTWTEGKR